MTITSDQAPSNAVDLVVHLKVPCPSLGFLQRRHMHSMSLLLTALVRSW